MVQQRRGRGRPTGSRVDPAVRYEELLDAAESAIREHGPQASLVEVARHAGFGRSAVYALFPSRNAMLAALSKRHVARIMTTLAERTRGADDPRERVSAFIDNLCAWIEDEPQLYRALSGHALMGGDDEHGIFEELADATEQVLTKNLRELGAPTDAAAPWSRAMIGSTAAAAAWWQRTATMSRAELVQHLTVLSWGGGVRMPLYPPPGE
ncbi:TetR/AcrR family transcriptional regulator [Nocardia sp. NBC_01499]|uniref:TetR/AcrR family transcriptional regulator n=1 Tax=Nocardia sp. NBC_01499 TaxID=2903597 RepID=UPI00386DD324